MKHKKKKATSDRKQPISKSEIEHLRCLAERKVIDDFANHMLLKQRQSKC